MDQQFFGGTEKGEIAEMRAQLRSSRRESRESAMKRILAAMLKGAPVDLLFPDVLKCAQTDCLKLKKLVIFYLTATARRNSDLAMLAVNTLSRDFSSPLPLVRALALRAVAGMGVSSLTQHLVASLQQCLADENAYVRKTAALCVAKLHMSEPAWVEEVGLLDQLRGLLRDSNAAVLVNVLAALMDMRKLPPMDFPAASRLLAALSESHEWGQVTILDAVTRFKPSAPWEVLALCDRISPFLAHANAAVALTCVRALQLLIPQLPTDQDRTNLMIKLGPPLKTLLSAEPAIQYVTLRNIQLLLLKHPQLIRDVRAFYVKYNDPIYVKMEKLQVLVQLADEETMVEIISELRLYAGEADVQFVRSAVRAIGRCAVKLAATADRCVQTLLGLIETDISYVIESAIIAFRDIIRRYPRRYEGAINVLSGRLSPVMDDAEARAAFAWMLGEYAMHITDVEDLLQDYLENFPEEVATVQLATLTAVVKAFLQQPTSTHLVHSVLEQAVAAPNPDLRDRAFIYWRLLSTDPAAARDVVLAERPPIAAHELGMPPSLLDELLGHIGTLASVYHKLPLHYEDNDAPTSKGDGCSMGARLFLQDC